MFTVNAEVMVVILLGSHTRKLHMLKVFDEPSSTFEECDAVVRHLMSLSICCVSPDLKSLLVAVAAASSRYLADTSCDFVRSSLASEFQFSNPRLSLICVSLSFCPVSIQPSIAFITMHSSVFLFLRPCSSFYGALVK